MLPQVTAEHPFLEDPPLFQFLFRWPRLHECPEEGDELPVLLGHCTRQGNSHFIPHLATTEHNSFYRAHWNWSHININYLQEQIFQGSTLNRDLAFVPALGLCRVTRSQLEGRTNTDTFLCRAASEGLMVGSTWEGQFHLWERAGEISQLRNVVISCANPCVIYTQKQSFVAGLPSGLEPLQNKGLTAISEGEQVELPESPTCPPSTLGAHCPSLPHPRASAAP